MLPDPSTVLSAQPYEYTAGRKVYTVGFNPKVLHTLLCSLGVDIPQPHGNIDFYPHRLEKLFTQRQCPPSHHE